MPDNRVLHGIDMCYYGGKFLQIDRNKIYDYSIVHIVVQGYRWRIV